MKYIWLGIKDYCKDVWHDWLLDRLQASYPNATIYFYDHGYDANFETCHWKEGNLWHYIQQRKAAKLLKEIKTLQEELKQKGNK